MVRLLVAVLFLGGDVETTPDCRGWEGGTVIFLEVPECSIFWEVPECSMCRFGVATRLIITHWRRGAMQQQTAIWG